MDAMRCANQETCDPTLLLNLNGVSTDGIECELIHRDNFMCNESCFLLSRLASLYADIWSGEHCAKLQPSISR